MSKTIHQVNSRSQSPDMVMGNNSLKKFLDSHSSIYNALNNPDLDKTDSELPIRTPDMMESQFSVTSWQSISQESMPQICKKTPSILSVTSDEEDMVDMNEMDEGNGALVFDGEEDQEQNSTSFIMPKLNVSSSYRTSKSLDELQITVLSSCSNYTSDTKQLVKEVKNDLGCNSVNITHLTLNKGYSNKDQNIIEGSDLIFIVNDGSCVFVDFLANINFREDTTPKLTIINMITVNYFINLFELINSLKPYQIWKAASLKQENLINKFKDFIEVEVNQKYENSSRRIRSSSSSTSSCPSGAYSLAIESNSHYSNDYKSIEKQYKHDLRTTATFNDPLQVSSRFFHVNVLYYLVKKCFSYPNNLILVFGCGFGLGVDLPGVLAFTKNCLFSNSSKSVYPLSKQDLWGGNPFNGVSIFDPLVSSISESSSSFTPKFSFLMDNMLSDFKFFSSRIIDCIWGGIDKLVALVLV